MSKSSKQVFGGPVVVGGNRIPLSKAIRAGDFVFASGQVPFDAEGNIVTGTIEEETRASLDSLSRVLAEAGCTLSDVVKVTGWLKDAGDFAAFNTVYGEYFSEDSPARSIVESRMVIDCKVEVEAVAYKP
jgi:2-iminobutanoate/2-iminopropanoate deaminase